MNSHYFHSPQARVLATSARTICTAGGLLYHGTPASAEIMKTGALLYSGCGMPAVSFSRSPEVAAYWAVLPRDEPFEVAAVLAFSRRALQATYRLEPFSFFEGSADPLEDEMEEIVFGRVVENLSRSLAGIVYLKRGETRCATRVLRQGSMVGWVSPPRGEVKADLLPTRGSKQRVWEQRG